MKIIIISLFFIISTSVFAQQADKEIGSFDILDGLTAVSHSKAYITYLRPVVFTSPANSLAWGLSIRKGL
ncbi:MAG: hypothetical protein NTY22_09655 [Proteobacteria bacterium]|nr:hypothetical protein [Pseudomonadota bacterium]